MLQKIHLSLSNYFTLALKWKLFLDSPSIFAHSSCWWRNVSTLAILWSRKFTNAVNPTILETALTWLPLNKNTKLSTILCNEFEFCNKYKTRGLFTGWIQQHAKVIWDIKERYIYKNIMYFTRVAEAPYHASAKPLTIVPFDTLGCLLKVERAVSSKSISREKNCIL
jgi:hypothetical protein